MILHHTMEATSLAIDCQQAVRRAGICCELSLTDEEMPGRHGIRLESLPGENLELARQRIVAVLER